MPTITHLPLLGSLVNRNRSMILFLMAPFSLFFGFFLMLYDKEPYGYGLLGLTIGPIFLLAGFILFIPAIFSLYRNTDKVCNEPSHLASAAGWFAFFISFCLYAYCAEPTVSFWDCGEFIASAYRLEIPHPPGAPLFLLVGRVFSMLAPSKDWIAFCVNMVSVVASAFTVLFLYKSIILLLNKLYSENSKKQPIQQYQVVCASLTGSLAFAFSDSFWFNAEEAEVYALSCLFTSLVFWCILKWDAAPSKLHAEKWLLLIAYLTGLSIGVHLLSLIAIPALGAMMYFKRAKVHLPGLAGALSASLLLMFFIISGVITGLVSVAANFEVFFVNTLGLPFDSGAILFIVTLMAGVFFLIWWAHKHKKNWLQIGASCFALLLIGYSSYFLVLIRSGYNTPLDENNPEDVMSLLLYLNRDQYGSRPLLKGPQYTASQPQEVVKTNARYRKDTLHKKYIVYDYDYKYVYKPQDEVLFPRMYSNEARHRSEYAKWVAVRPGKNPTMAQNLQYFFSYQIWHMYGRYFLWNFAGRLSDIQDTGTLLVGSSNNDKLPDNLKTNKGRNNYYLLPLVLGMVGCWFHFKNRQREAVVVSLLFLFGGLAIVVYLNQPPSEPRERDYAYVASYYAFAIWIAFGAACLLELYAQFVVKFRGAGFVASALCLSVPIIMLAENFDDHSRKGRYFAEDASRNVLSACAPNAILFTAADNDTFPLWYLQEVEGYRTDVRICNLSLLNVDWYIDCMKRWSNASAPLPISLDYAHYVRGKNEQVYVVPNPRLAKGIYLDKYLQLFKEDHSLLQHPGTSDQNIKIIPSSKLLLHVPTNIRNELPTLELSKANASMGNIEFNLSSTLSKSQLMVLDIISTNDWKRPIYFQSNAVHEHAYLKKYLQKVGFVMRLAPLENSGEPLIDTQLMYQNLMHRSAWRGLDNPDVYTDVAAMPFIALARMEFADLAQQLMVEGKIKKALEVLKYSLKVMPEKSIPFNYSSVDYPSMLSRLGESKLAYDACSKLALIAYQTLIYEYASGRPDHTEVRYQLFILQKMVECFGELGNEKLATKYQKVFDKYYQLLYKAESGF